MPKVNDVTRCNNMDKRFEIPEELSEGHLIDVFNDTLDRSVMMARILFAVNDCIAMNEDYMNRHNVRPRIWIEPCRTPNVFMIEVDGTFANLHFNKLIVGCNES